MQRILSALLVLIVLVVVGSISSAAESHRATWLGNPPTRFAEPLQTPEDLRARFADAKLKPDFASVLRQWRWIGNPEDMHRAALTNEIVEWPIAVGTVMPFMSTRKNGHPICLINVEWAGKEPAPAYAFLFTSRGRRYRCITPKACSNFFVVDLGPEPKPLLALECNAPAEVPVGRPAEICVTIRNTGDASEPKTTITLPIPEGAKVTQAGEGGTIMPGRVVWDTAELAPGDSKKLCATFTRADVGSIPIAATAVGTVSGSLKTECVTKVIGIPAILLEVVDLEDPIEIGKEVTYRILVTNQGTATGTNIRLTCLLDSSQEYVTASGNTPALAHDRTVTFDPLPVLEPKAVASWLVTVRAVKEEDVRFKVELRSDQFERPITEDESTRQY